MTVIVGVVTGYAGFRWAAKATNDLLSLNSDSQGIGDTQNARIVRVVGRILTLVGLFFIGVGLMMMGAVLCSATPSVTLGALMDQVFSAGHYYRVCGMVCIVGGTIFQLLGS